MTTIVAQVTDKFTRLYADQQVCMFGHAAFTTCKLLEVNGLTVALTGTLNYAPPIEDLDPVSAQSLFKLVHEWYIKTLGAYKGEQQTLDSSPLYMVVMDNTGIYSNQMGAPTGIKHGFGISAFGKGEEFAQGYFAACPKIDHKQVKAMYQAISKLGYATSASCSVAEVLK
jgi:ATP-dependent protease HslVU (ClpYQ) peptidase subunit